MLLPYGHTRPIERTDRVTIGIAVVGSIRFSNCLAQQLADNATFSIAVRVSFGSTNRNANEPTKQQSIQRAVAISYKHSNRRDSELDTANSWKVRFRSRNRTNMP